MEVKEEIIRAIRSDTKNKPYSFIYSEVQKPDIYGDSINPNIRRIVREWIDFFTQNKDNVNLNKITNIQSILCNHIIHNFVKNTALNIPNNKIKSIHEEFGVQFVISLINNIKSKNIDFPFKKYSISPEHLNRLINNTNEFKSSELIVGNPFTLSGVIFSEDTNKLFPNAFALKDEGEIDDSYSSEFKYFNHNTEEYKTIDIITDYFTETERMKSIRSDQAIKASPYDIWISGGDITKDIVVNSLNKSLMSSLDLNMDLLREEIFESTKKDGGIKESTQFKVSLAKSVIHYFCPDPSSSKMLDISAGWGDRLIAAASSKLAGYFACDPNTNLKSGHDNIIDTIIPVDKKHLYKINYEPFETVTIPKDEKFNLIFSSPPFFDLEIYDNDAKQSIYKFSDGNKWLVDFLFASLSKAWEHLIPGGHMVIHITDVPTLKICEPMVLFCQTKLSGCYYLGVLGSKGDAGIVRPMWVFKKMTTGSSGMARDAKKILKTNFNEIFKFL